MVYENLNIKMQNNLSKIFYFFMLVVATIMFTVYYYGIQVTIFQDSEALYPIVGIHDGWLIGYDIYTKVCEYAYLLFGLTYTSIRAVHCFFYFIISLFTFDLCVRDNNWNIKVYAIPIYLLFMVQMHLGSDFLYGYRNANNAYPFDQHMITTMVAVISMWIVYRSISYLEGEYGIVTGILLIFLFIICWKVSDSLYLIIFLIPFILTIIDYKKISEKLMGVTLFVSVMVVALLKVGAVFSPFFGNLIISDTKQYSGFYGVCNYITPDKLVDNIVDYFVSVLSLYNVDFWGTSILYVQIIPWLFRACLVICIFSIITKTLKDIMNKKNENKINALIAISFVLLMIFAIFTENGGNNQIRYNVIMIPYGTILLSLNYEQVVNRLKVSYLQNRKLLFVFGLLLLVASHDSKHGDIIENDFWDMQNRQIIEIVKNEKLSRGAARVFLAPSIYVRSGGECPVDAVEWRNEGFSQFNEYYSGQKYDYIINDTSRKTYNYFDVEYRKMIEIYGEPDCCYELNNYTIYIYRDGIVIE